MQKICMNILSINVKCISLKSIKIQILKFKGNCLMVPTWHKGPKTIICR